MTNLGISERLKEIRAAKNMNQIDFAKLLGIGQSTLAMMEVNKRKISERHVKTICSICNVNETWLRTGKGNMFIKNDDSLFNSFAEKYNLTRTEQGIAKYCLQLTTKQRAELMDHVVNIAEIIKSTQKDND